MVICTYFQRGICHFGDKCKNEHISSFSYRPESKINEIRIAVTSEADTVLNGKQWILSCFAPFRDKLQIIIPDFIDDISPEEVRLECYQAKANGTLPLYTQTIAKKIEDSTRNMQMLKTCSADVLNFLFELYSGNINANSNNPFRSSQNFIRNNIFAPSQNNVFGGPPSFGQQNVFHTQAQAPNNHLFQSNEQNMIQQASSIQNPLGGTYSQPGNIFAAAANNVFSASSNPFTFALQQSSAANAASSNSVFGQPTIASNVAPGNSVFGHSTNAASGNTIFRQPPTTFGQTSNTPFGQVPNTNSPFGSITNAVKTAFSQPADMTKANLVFAQANNANLPFVQPAAQLTENASGFQQVHSTNNSGAAFGQVAAPSNVFGTTSLGNNNNVFIDSKPKTNEGVNVFQINTQASDNPFLVPHKAKRGLLSVYDSNSNVFSDVQNLTDDDVAAFRNSKFKLGGIPLNPPAKEFCME